MRFSTKALAIAFAASFSEIGSVSAMSSRVIDSHLHVWASLEESKTFPYVGDSAPPESLQNKASFSELLKHMKANGVDGSLIVQPINHKYDHSYVLQAIKEHPAQFKGMMLHDPSLDEARAVARLDELALKGFVGVRFNPYLWPALREKQWKLMSDGPGMAVYKRCAELNMPVGVMCFHGLSLHYNDIVQLLETSPQTTMILDHFGFSKFNDAKDFEKLLSLAKYPQVHVKISALFRLGDESPYDNVRVERFDPLLNTFGAERLLFGSDFPFVLEQPEAYGVNKIVSSWIINEKDRQCVMGGTAERLFGPWDVVPDCK
jgi:predicted TIM-barrel fold metal-dependent hydrolase